MLITTYLFASAILFTISVIGCLVPPHKESDRWGAAIFSVFATFGWVCAFSRVFS